ncbi:WD40-repeat-containing domain protein [Crucibulum laeve]|uniref:WD40-repeat-containing domain protein n=1 Tax=Crucibulum laeve TaxID=68775 RepID=A0A5C3MJ37_9AGAR|nr:WD40-repeat-containing domain protein [Crucibulum laeve]
MYQDHLAPEELPWFRDRTRANPPPFQLVNKISSRRPDATSFRSLAFFPWTVESLHTLWQGSLRDQDASLWKKTISEFADAVAIGSRDSMYVFFVKTKRNPICVTLPSEPDLRILPPDCMNVAWSLSPHALDEPMLIFSRGSLLYIYNVVRKGIASYLRGHGGTITSIVVHPVTANLFCTTSRDYSTRIYDITLPPQREPKNPHWPPSKKPSLAGAAHGLHMTEPEGNGLGRCIVVLMGGRSGGHQAAVLGAAFHPKLPIIATCGLDRTVKIWLIRPTSHDTIKREDKPLFSSARIHKARVLSIAWLLNHDDMLLAHSAPAVMRVKPTNPHNKETYLEPGELTVFRWLGLDRFFPPGHEDTPRDTLKGCASDYQESSSFKLISISAFPEARDQYTTARLQVYQSPTHDPMILCTLPNASSFFIMNAAHLPPPKATPFPLDEPVFTAGLESIHLDDDDTDSTRAAELKEENERRARMRRLELRPPELKAMGWEVPIGVPPEVVDNGAGLHCCAMGMEGSVIVGVGSKGTIWVWALDETGLST